MKKRAWHTLVVERIKSGTLQILKRPDEREDVRGERMAVIEELISLLERSFLAPEAVVEIRTEFLNLLGTFPWRVSGNASLVRRYLRQTLRKLN